MTAGSLLWGFLGKERSAAGGGDLGEEERGPVEAAAQDAGAALHGDIAWLHRKRALDGLTLQERNFFFGFQANYTPADPRGQEPESGKLRSSADNVRWAA